MVHGSLPLPAWHTGIMMHCHHGALPSHNAVTDSLSQKPRFFNDHVQSAVQCELCNARGMALPAGHLPPRERSMIEHSTSTPLSASSVCHSSVVSQDHGSFLCPWPSMRRTSVRHAITHVNTLPSAQHAFVGEPHALTLQQPVHGPLEMATASVHDGVAKQSGAFLRTRLTAPSCTLHQIPATYSLTVHPLLSLPFPALS